MTETSKGWKICEGTENVESQLPVEMNGKGRDGNAVIREEGEGEEEEKG